MATRRKDHLPRCRLSNGAQRNNIIFFTGFLKETIKEARTMFGLDDSWNPSENTINSRLKNGIQDKLDPRPGLVSPMVEIEDVLVQYIVYCNRANRPLDRAETIDLANSLIRRTATEEKVIEFKLAYNPSARAEYQRTQERPSEAFLDDGWYRGFLQRRKDEIETGKPIKFDERRASWCTYAAFDGMYTRLYLRFVEMGHAVKLDEAVWQDLLGNDVAEEDAYGEKVEYKLTHPHLIIMFDEMGSNTNTTKDKLSGNERVLGGAGERKRQAAYNGDSHFTGLGVTLATGEPLMAVIILSKESDLEPKELLGRNEGVNTCHYNGKDIPCLVTHSESGGMTPGILVQILSRLDKLKVFPRNEGDPYPALLVDGHGSRLDLEFLDYIFDEEHRWELVFGLPHGTSYWQVGDSKAQNGCMKASLSKNKTKIVREKLDRAERGTVERSNVVQLFNDGWPGSFGNVENNKKAIAIRGWGPLNRGCLHMKEIADTKVDSTSAESESESVEMPDSQETQISRMTADTSQETLDSLNLDGFGGHLLATLNRRRIRTQNQAEERAKRQEELRGLTESQRLDKLHSGARLTTGELHNLDFCHVPHALYLRMKQSCTEKQKKTMESRLSQHRANLKIYDKGIDLRVSKPNESDWGKEDFKFMIQFKVLGRRKEDYYNRMPGDIDDRRQLWEDRCRQLPDPPIPYLENAVDIVAQLMARGTSDDEMSLSEDEAAAEQRNDDPSGVEEPLNGPSCTSMVVGV